MRLLNVEKMGTDRFCAFSQTDQFGLRLSYMKGGETSDPYAEVSLCR